MSILFDQKNNNINGLLTNLIILKNVYDEFKILTKSYIKEINDIIVKVLNTLMISGKICGDFDTNLIQFMNNTYEIAKKIENKSNSKTLNFSYEKSYKIQKNKWIFHKYICIIDSIMTDITRRELNIGENLFIFLSSNDIIIQKSDPYNPDNIMYVPNFINSLKCEIEKLNVIIDIISENETKLISTIQSLK